MNAKPRMAAIPSAAIEPGVGPRGRVVSSLSGSAPHANTAANRGIRLEHEE